MCMDKEVDCKALTHADLSHVSLLPQSFLTPIKICLVCLAARGQEAAMGGGVWNCPFYLFHTYLSVCLSSKVNWSRIGSVPIIRIFRTIMEAEPISIDCTHIGTVSMLRQMHRWDVGPACLLSAGRLAHLLRSCLMCIDWSPQVSSAQGYSLD